MFSPSHWAPNQAGSSVLVDTTIQMRLRNFMLSANAVLSIYSFDFVSCYTNCILCVAVMMVTARDENEYRLTRHLLSNYDKSVRPARYTADPVNVTFGLALTQIIDVVRSMKIVDILF